MDATSGVLDASRDQRRERIILNHGVNNLALAKSTTGFSGAQAHAGRRGIAIDVAVTPIGTLVCIHDVGELAHVC